MDSLDYVVEVDALLYPRRHGHDVEDFIVVDAIGQRIRHSLPDCRFITNCRSRREGYDYGGPAVESYSQGILSK